MKNIKFAPSSNGYITPRTEEVRLTTENCELILLDKIDSIEKVLLSGDFEIEILAGMVGNPTTKRNITVKLSDLKIKESESATEEYSIKNLDVTKYFVEAQNYGTLELTEKGIATPAWYNIVCKENVCLWQRGANKLYVKSEIYGGWLDIGIPVAYAMVYSALAELARGKYVYADVYVNGEGNPPYRGIIEPVLFTDIPTQGKFENAVTIADDWQDIRKWAFRVEYVPQSESIKLVSVKSDITDMQFDIPFNQQQQRVSARALGKQGQALANRTGVKTKEVVRIIPKQNYKRYMREIGSVCVEDDVVWRLNVVQTEFIGKHIKVIETWGENWNNQSQFAGINRQARSWNIPNQFIYRDLHIDEYLLLTDKPNAIQENAILSGTGKQKVLTSFKSAGALDDEQNCMWLFTRTEAPNGRLEEGVVLNASAFGYGNSIVFTAKTKDNLSAGITKNGEICRDAFYCNSDGTLDKRRITFGHNISNADYDLYPIFISRVGMTGSVQKNTPVGTTAIDGYELDIRKDAGEQLGFTYQLHCVTDNSSLVIGAGWANNCPLVRKFDNKQIKVWELTKPLPQGMQTMSTSYGQETTESVYAVNEEQGFFVFMPKNGYGVCVTDIDNNIIIGYNGSVGKIIYAYLTKDYNIIRRWKDNG